MSKIIIIWVIVIIILLVIGFSLIGKKADKLANGDKAQNENQNAETTASGSGSAAENEITDILNDLEETEMDDGIVLSEEGIISAPSE